MNTYDNCLFSGYTPHVKTPRDLAIERLEKVADQMTEDEFCTWLEDIARTATSIADFHCAADSWLADDCTHCQDGMCNCTYHNQEIVY